MKAEGGVVKESSAFSSFCERVPRCDESVSVHPAPSAYGEAFAIALVGVVNAKGSVESTTQNAPRNSGGLAATGRVQLSAQ